MKDLSQKTASEKQKAPQKKQKGAEHSRVRSTEARFEPGAASEVASRIETAAKAEKTSENNSKSAAKGGAGRESALGTQPNTRLEAALAYRFHDKRLLERALTHSSLAYEQLTSQTGATKAQRAEMEDNEQLEFLGDAVLGMVAAEALYRAHPEMSEGQLTRLRAALVSRKHMAQVAHRLSLGNYLRMGRGEERSGGRKKPALLANAAEALLAAIYLDAASRAPSNRLSNELANGSPHASNSASLHAPTSKTTSIPADQRPSSVAGLAAVEAVILRHVIEPSLPALLQEAERSTNIGDHKSALQEYLQSAKLGQPEYVVAGQSGPDHRKRFLVEVHLPTGTESAEKALARGVGSTKKHAEQEAARRALKKLRSSTE